MNRKRLITVSFLSIILVATLYIQKTQSIYTTTAPDEEVNTYKTGVLDIEVIGDTTPIENILPTSIENSNKLTPYRITVINKGTVTYQFNLILEETTSSNKIDNQYIITKVGSLDPKPLNECKNNILKENILVAPNTSVDIDVRIWITDKVPNTEMNKSFFSKLKIVGEATNNTTSIDNSNLVSTKEEIKEQTGS